MSRRVARSLRQPPPFGREVLKARNRFAPVYVYVGEGAWERGRRRAVLLPGSVLVLPPKADPFGFDWSAAIQPDQSWPGGPEAKRLGEPVARIHVVGPWDSHNTKDPLEQLSAALLLAGAARVEVSSDSHFEDLTIRAGGGPRPWMRR